MISALLVLGARAIDPIVRDDWGIPHIRALTVEQAWFLAGYATAQDRLWQMETSRRVAEGRMAEAFGPKYADSDAETLKLGYTREELLTQYRNLSGSARLAINAYAHGVNSWIIEAGRLKKLPSEFGTSQLKPKPWEPVDSIAIGVSLLQRFGKGSSGQLRNLAGLEYFRMQPSLKGHELDVLDDFLPANDPLAPTTVLPEDEPRDMLRLPIPTRADSERQLAKLPKVNLLELLPALKVVEHQESTLVAKSMGAPFQVGSYAMVVSPSRSSTGKALLLSAPQMGFSAPSVLHELSLSAPGLEVSGVDVPGLPGVLVGSTKAFAWGLTTGEADTDDVFVYPRVGDKAYRDGTRTRSITRVEFKLAIQGGEPKTVVQQRTEDGPVVFETKTHLFVRRASYWQREMRAYGALMNLYAATSPDQIEEAIDPAPMNFNFFYATTAGETGYLYVGDIPLRAPGIDPRLPTPGLPANAWRGVVPKSRLPRVRNPRSGLLTNWNNRPSRGWPNQDAPSWQEIDHVLDIRNSLDKPTLRPDDLNAAAMFIATRETPVPFFQPFLTQISSTHEIKSQGGYPPAVFRAWLDALRREIFLPQVGPMVADEFFRVAISPSLILHALQGKTKFDFLGGRSVQSLVDAAADQVNAGPVPSLRDQIEVLGEAPIPYGNRGTFTQLVELTSPPSLRTVLPPGEASAGPHRTDQAALARRWELKLMPWRP